MRLCVRLLVFLAAGVVLAVRGRAEPGGDFVVDAVLLPGLPPQPARPPVQEDMYVAIVSGLQLASGAADVMRVWSTAAGFWGLKI